MVASSIFIPILHLPKPGQKLAVRFPASSFSDTVACFKSHHPREVLELY
jgi:hypothetical protein